MPPTVSPLRLVRIVPVGMKTVCHWPTALVKRMEKAGAVTLARLVTMPAPPAEPVPPNTTSLLLYPAPPPPMLLQFALSDQFVLADTPGLPIHKAVLAKEVVEETRRANETRGVMSRVCFIKDRLD